MCESLAPQVFEVRPDGMMYVLAQDVAADDADVRDAVAASPSFALRLVLDGVAGTSSTSGQP